MEEKDISFTTAMTLEQSRVPTIPQRYVLPPSQRPNPNLPVSATLPIMDLSLLHNQSLRAQTIKEIQIACKEFGFFQVINHGVHQAIINDALETASKFFNLPHEEKMHLFSGDVHKPIRYGTSLNHTVDEVFCWRDFIKHNSHPISDWIHMWPSNPTCYREKMGKYSKAIQELQKELMGIILESLGLNPKFLQEEIEKGQQTLAVNCYPACPEPGQTLGIPPHSDFGSVTILLQTRSGLQIKDQNKNWVPVPCVDGALIVQIGDQLEVLSNGQYKSVIYRAMVNAQEKRFSIASLHSFGLETKVGPVPELVNEEHPRAYKEFSFREFLDFISRNEVTKGRFLDTLKMKS